MFYLAAVCVATRERQKAQVCCECARATVTENRRGSEISALLLSTPQWGCRHRSLCAVLCSELHRGCQGKQGIGALYIDWNSDKIVKASPSLPPFLLPPSPSPIPYSFSSSSPSFTSPSPSLSSPSFSPPSPPLLPPPVPSPLCSQTLTTHPAKDNEQGPEPSLLAKLEC